MPDTGAPWNIPYVESTDLVSDWPTDSLALANAIDAGLDVANAGIGSNVVNATSTSGFSTTSTSYVDVTGLSLTFTPTSATSKVLIIVSAFSVQNDTQGDYCDVAVDRGGTTIAESRMRQAATFGANSYFARHVLDSPATTSAITYKVQMKQLGGGTASMQGSSTAPATLTAIEVTA